MDTITNPTIPQVTTGPLPASRKIYVSPPSAPDLRVPLREIETADPVEPLVRVYDTTGPYTDPAATIDVRRGLPLGPDVSMLKVIQTELFQKITDAMMDIAGENAGLLEPIEGNRNLHPAGQFIQARPSTIYGGSNEIQRNILARNVLALPA